jgi:hypothetical protein
MDGATRAAGEIDRLTGAAEVSVALDRADGTISGAPIIPRSKCGLANWDDISVARSKPDRSAHWSRRHALCSQMPSPL